MDLPSVLYNTNGRPGIPVSIVSLISAAALLSFLKQTHRPWTERDISKALNVSSAEGKQAIAAMQLQGYAEPIARTQKWRTTEQGLAVSGAKSARFTREAVEQGLANLADRIQTNNGDPNSEYAVSEAVAFGDFLSDQPRVQAADVGIRLTPEMLISDDSGSAVEHKAQEVPEAASWQNCCHSYLALWSMDERQVSPHAAANVRCRFLRSKQGRIQSIRGAVEAAKYVDLIGVDEDPLTDITVLQRVKFVMKGGTVVKHALPH